MRPSAIYLNQAASSWPKAPGVAEAMLHVLQGFPEHPGRSGHRSDPVGSCRARLAHLLGSDRPDRIVLAVNSTQALNLAILGLDLPARSLVLTTVAEHNSVLRPLHHLALQRGLRIQTVGLDDRGAIDARAWDAALRERPRLAVLNHASNVTGRIHDAADLLGRARRAGAVTLLDASQTLGAVPVSAAALSADLVAFTGHKALHGPPGTGGLFVDPRLELTQLFVGGTGVRSDLPHHPEEMPMRLEAGTPNVPAIAGLTAALEWVADRAPEFLEREHALGRSLRAGLRETPGVRVCGDGDGPWTATVSFRIAGWGVEEAGFALGEAFGIACRTGLHCAPLIHAAIGSAPAGTIRLSASGFNTPEEIETALDAVGRLAHTRSRQAEDEGEQAA